MASKFCKNCITQSPKSSSRSKSSSTGKKVQSILETKIPEKLLEDFEKSVKLNKNKKKTQQQEGNH